MIKYFKFPLFVFLIFPLFSFSQSEGSQQDIYNWFDDVVGFENIGIYNGVEYKEKNKVVNKNHSYFGSVNFLVGSIDYDGESYFNLNMKYDLHEQDVIVKIKNSNASEFVVKLLKEKIKGFTINTHRFVKIKGIDLKGNSISGYYEEVLSGSKFKFLIRHQKIKSELYRDFVMYAEYKMAKKEYVVSLDNNYKILKAKSDIIDLFPELKAHIHSYYKVNRQLKRLDYDKFLTELLKELKLLTA